MAGTATYLVAALTTALVASALSPDQNQQKPFGVLESKSSVYHVRHELQKAEIIPTVMDEFLPSLLLDVKWSSDDHASLGNTLKVGNVQGQPTIKAHRDSASSSSLLSEDMAYTITITDPDAPSRDNPEWSEICHYIATGVKLSSSVDGSPGGLSGLKDVMPYKAPGPPPKTGKHRYVFLLFAPANGTTDSLNLTKPDDRMHWGTGKERHGVKDWALENGLQPVAANFIYAQNEEQ